MAGGPVGNRTGPKRQLNSRYGLQDIGTTRVLERLRVPRVRASSVTKTARLGSRRAISMGCQETHRSTRRRVRSSTSARSSVAPWCSADSVRARPKESAQVPARRLSSELAPFQATIHGRPAASGWAFAIVEQAQAPRRARGSTFASRSERLGRPWGCRHRRSSGAPLAHRSRAVRARTEGPRFPPERCRFGAGTGPRTRGRG